MNTSDIRKGASFKRFSNVLSFQNLYQIDFTYSLWPAKLEIAVKSRFDKNKQTCSSSKSTHSHDSHSLTHSLTPNHPILPDIARYQRRPDPPDLLHMHLHTTQHDRVPMLAMLAMLAEQCQGLLVVEQQRCTLSFSPNTLSIDTAAQSVLILKST